MHLNKGKYDRAIKDFTKALSLNPRYVKAYFSRGVCYIKTKKPHLAARDFRQCLKLNPNVPQAAQIRDWLKKRGK